MEKGKYFGRYLEKSSMLYGEENFGFGFYILYKGGP